MIVNYKQARVRLSECSIQSAQLYAVGIQMDTSLTLSLFSN